MKYNKILILFAMFLAIFSMTITCLGSSTDKITKDFKLNSYSSFNGNVQYGVFAKKDNKDTLLTFKASDYNLPSNLYDYKNDIRLRITYSQIAFKVLDCKVVNNKTGEIITDLSENNLNKLFNIEYQENIIEKNWTDVIKLSELKQNQIYKYTASSTVQFPKIENDTGKNCIIYLKERDNKNYDKDINMYKEISSNSISISFNEYKSQEAFNIKYEEIGNKELLELIKKDNIIYLSNYSDGDNIQDDFKNYIYNDTDKNITIKTKSKNFGVETSDSVVIEKGQIYGYDWKIDSAIVSYNEGQAVKPEVNNNEKPIEKNDEEQNTNNEEEKNEQNFENDDVIQNDLINQEDEKETENTQNTETTPQLIVNTIMILGIILIITITIVSYIKYKKSNNIE